MKTIKKDKKFHFNASLMPIIFCLTTAVIVFITPLKLEAQFQDFTFSGSDKQSYQCFNADGSIFGDASKGPDSAGNFHCSNGALAYLKPPKLQQLEIWFIRVLYSIWALTGTLSFLFLLRLGYEYIISQGDITKITEIRKRIVNYVLGFALVFLAIPILTTVFRVIGINNDVQCYNVSMPGFQFFFKDLCTASVASITNPCASDQSALNKTCPTGTGPVSCKFLGILDTSCYYCDSTDPDNPVWKFSGFFDTDHSAHCGGLFGS